MTQQTKIQCFVYFWLHFRNICVQKFTFMLHFFHTNVNQGQKMKFSDEKTINSEMKKYFKQRIRLEFCVDKLRRCGDMFTRRIFATCLEILKLSQMSYQHMRECVKMDAGLEVLDKTYRKNLLDHISHEHILPWNTERDYVTVEGSEKINFEIKGFINESKKLLEIISNLTINCEKKFIKHVFIRDFFCLCNINDYFIREIEKFKFLNYGEEIPGMLEDYRNVFLSFKDTFIDY